MGSYLINNIIDQYDINPDEDAHFQFVSGASYMEDYKSGSENYASIAIYNKVGSGKVIKINRCDLEFLYNSYSGYALTGEASQVVKINSVTGGINVPIVKLNSGNNTLTALSVKEKSESTIVSSSILRKYKAVSLNHTSISGLLQNTNMPKNTYKGSTSASIQIIVLREGEGIAVKGINSYYNNTIIIDVIINVISGGSGSYFVTKTVPINTEGDLLSIFNESGSGLIFEVSSINITQLSIIPFRGGAFYNTLPYLYLSPIVNIEDYTGDNLTPIKMDSTNSLSSNILIKKNCVVNYDFQSFVLQRPKIYWFMPSIMYAGSPTLFFTTVPNNKLGFNNLFKTIELNEGEGIALMSRINVASGVLEFNMTFTETDAPTPPSGGETGFAYA